MRVLMAQLGAVLALVGFLVFGALLVTPAAVHAQFDPLDAICEDNPDADVCGDRTDTDPIVGGDGLLSRVITILATVTAITSVIIIVIAGMTMTLSSGNSQKVQSSRDAIIYAVIALAVAAAAQAIVVFVIRRITN